MVTLDANTKVNLGSLIATIALGAGAIWKVADLTSRVDVGNTRLGNIEQKVSELNDNMKGVLPRSEFDAWKDAQKARDLGQDSRMDRFDRLLDGDGHRGTDGGK